MADAYPAGPATNRRHARRRLFERVGDDVGAEVLAVGVVDHVACRARGWTHARSVSGS
jgi:hypothetical protein